MTQFSTLVMNYFNLKVIYPRILLPKKIISQIVTDLYKLIAITQKKIITEKSKILKIIN